MIQIKVPNNENRQEIWVHNDCDKFAYPNSETVESKYYIDFYKYETYNNR